MERIKIKDILDYKFISGFKANPSRTQAAFVVAKAHHEKNNYQHQLYTFIDEKAKRVMSLKKDSSFIWDNDNTLLFPYKKTKAEEKKITEKYQIYYRYDIESETLSHAFTLPILGDVVKNLGNDLYLVSAVLTAQEHALYQSSEENRKEVLKKLKDAQLYEEIQEIPFYGNGMGFIANKRRQLFIYDYKKEQLTPIVDPDFNLMSFEVSADLKQIYYTGKQARAVRTTTANIFVYNVDTKTTEVLFKQDTHKIGRLFLLEDKIIVEASEMKEYGLNQNFDFYTLKNQELIPFKPYSLSTYNSMGSDVRKGGSQQTFIYQNKIYFVRTNDDHTEMMTLDANKQLDILFVMDGSIDGLEVINDQIYLVGLHKQKLQEIYGLEEAKVKQKTRINGKALKNKYIAKPKTIISKNATYEIKGFVLYPKDFSPKETYPLILNIHGGPKTIYGQVFYHEMQYWANAGYIVCFANPRGSDGKGNEFADIRGKYGTIDYDDLMGFLDLVIKKVPQVDEKNIFVTGGSYGGFMTNWMVGQTRRFRAAATQRSITNWISFHGTSDIGYYFSKDQVDGHPLTHTKLLWDHSPLKYAHKIETPLLIIHSDEDYRCPIEQAIQFYTILKENGLDTRFVWFKGENHELSRSGKPKARIKRLQEITRWFNQHISK